MSNIRLIGDAHGKLDEYDKLIAKVKASLGLGEMGFSGADILRMTCRKKNMVGESHLVLPGNHDNYDVIGAFPHFLTNPGYGLFEEGPLGARPSFYVRGAASIDKAWRIEGHSWWADEELSYSELSNCAIPMYERIKPDIMVTHTCPDELVEGLLPRGYVKENFRTEQALQLMFELHEPKIWVFGHFHATRVFKVRGTMFIALGELATCDLDVSSLEYKVQAYPQFTTGE